MADPDINSQVADIGADDPGRYKVLKNGAVYDLELKRIVSGAALTSDSARALVQKRVENRRAAVRAAANENPRARAYAERFGTLAFLAAIAESAMVKAVNPSDPKAIEAANWLTRYTGESEEGESAQDNGLNELRGLIKDIADLARAVTAGDSGPDSGPGSFVDVESADV